MTTHAGADKPDDEGKEAGSSDDEQDLAPDLSQADRETVEKRKSPPARIVHEVIRQQGIEELDRPAASLVWSGVAAGVTIWLSLIAQAALMLKLPDTPWKPVIAALGYSVGFIVTILGRLQLFTETTIVAVLPLATHLSWPNLGRTLRLWALVFGANMLGTLAVAILIPHVNLVTPELLGAMIDVSSHLKELTPGDAFARGIPAGFVLATIAWLLPNTRGQEVWVVTLLTYIIALASFSHVIAGSAEAWLLMMTGHATFAFAAFGFILPALVGNIVGGTGLFAVLAHAQVRSEL
ncbi:formate/nitrite transporter family protein [Novosphingobium sp.]|uniref:formate/nitrite transporter family protein n=1 Tax=Novosphingobium sp. TaxID=1874826 RepID=UPI003B517C6D